MKKSLLVVLAVAFCSTFVEAKDPSNPPSFSGNWVLDFSQTKNPPPGLQSYTMVVSQDQEQLKVETSLQGDLQPAERQSGSYPSGGNPGGGYPGGSSGGYPGGRRGGMGMPGGGGIGMPGGGMGMPGSGGMGMPGGGGPHGEGWGTVAAYKLYPPNAVYKLDGSEATVQLGDSEQTEATSKAELEKNGEALKLSLMGTGSAGHKGGKVQVKEEWKLSPDGKSLRVDRNVKSPEGSGTVHLVFSKREVDSSNSSAPEAQ